MKGEVKFFHDMKNYGFINPEGQEDDVFVHISDVDGESLKEGDEVEFETEQGEKGPRAVDVKVL